MPDQSDALRALELIEKDAFQPGRNWFAAHDIVQRHEGNALFDAIHAFLHRIEGDRMNAGYWDRRAGTKLGTGDPRAELAALRAMAGRA